MIAICLIEAALLVTLAAATIAILGPYWIEYCAERRMARLRSRFTF